MPCTFFCIKTNFSTASILYFYIVGFVRYMHIPYLRSTFRRSTNKSSSRHESSSVHRSSNASIHHQQQQQHQDSQAGRRSDKLATSTSVHSKVHASHDYYDDSKKRNSHSPNSQRSADATHDALLFNHYDNLASTGMMPHNNTSQGIIKYDAHACQ